MHCHSNQHKLVLYICFPCLRPAHSWCYFRPTAEFITRTLCFTLTLFLSSEPCHQRLGSIRIPSRAPWLFGPHQTVDFSSLSLGMVIGAAGFCHYDFIAFKTSMTFMFMKLKKWLYTIYRGVLLFIVCWTVLYTATRIGPECCQSGMCELSVEYFYQVVKPLSIPSDP